MNIIDTIIVVVTCFFVIRGIFRGLTRELASIVGVIAGLYGALLFSPRVVKLFPAKIAASAYADILGFAVIFCGVIIVVHLAAALIRFALGITMLTWVDRLLGAGFGALKSALLLGVVFFVMTKYVHLERPVMKESKLYGHMVTTIEAMAGVVPKEMPATMNTKIKRLQQVWENRDK